VVAREAANAAGDKSCENDQCDADGVLSVPHVLIFSSKVLLKQEEDVEQDRVDGVHCRHKSEEKEETMIALADTCANPRTVVIVYFDAGLAITAMERSRGPHNVARAALHHSDFLRVDVAEVLGIADWGIQVLT